ncbi:hypothetical protein FRC14_008229 [Serendipita sp. 396]|nr:hypothetical protein FRC14_008229 [Serendipita sp. 396]
MANIYGSQSTSTSNWVTANAHNMVFEPSDLPPFSGMDFMHTLAPPGHIQGGVLWDGMPDVFSVEPRMFGVNDEPQGGQ